MKKIISALALSAIVGGFVFAEFDINLNYRQRANLYSHQVEGTEKALLFTDAYSGNGIDNLAMSMAGDIASFDVTLVGDQKITSKIRAKTLGASLSLGDFTAFAGVWADGKLNGSYRTKSDVDAGNIEGMDFEFKKLGSAFSASPAIFLDNMVQGVNGRSERIAVGGTYNVKFDQGNVKLNAVYVTNEDTQGTKPDNSNSLKGHAGVFLADANLKGVGNAEVVFKIGEANDLKKKGDDGKASGDKGATAMAFGAYVQPLMIQNLILTVGGTGSVVDGTFTDFSADLRVRYQVIPKKLSITSFHSYSQLMDGDYMPVGNAPTKSLANAPYIDKKELKDGTDDGGLKGQAKIADINRDQIMSNNIMVRYNVTDNFSVFGIVADMIGMGNVMGEGDGKLDPTIQLRCSGWAQFFATKNATVTAGVVYAVHNITESNDLSSYASWAVPVVVRIKM